ncbi:Mis12-domain-containing protein [Zopfia rhizophila CBS 207.26]|uniref:Mis12-domain-containing protein n=1 Tax=Zopfia rhizophila CBS 207.26 TaxID=1314779 RepID=A0A6A6ETU3_9PEZI|nr:Mis12-domain-containing protein [Zopfia rhizophila CBS 207.26]
MANTKQQENLLLTEHFTWTPISLIDDIINTVNEVLYKCTETLENGLSGADPAQLGFADRAASESRIPDTDEDGRPEYPEARLEIEEGIHKLETLMEGAVDRNFDKFEIWTLRNSLKVPEEVVGWVRLGHYENLTIPPKDSTITPESILALRRKLQETQKLHVALLTEKTRNEALLTKLRTLVQPPSALKREPRSSTSPSKPSMGADSTSPFAFLTHTPAAQDLGVQPLPLNNSTSTPNESRTPLTTHTTFTTSQLPYLRDLLGRLKPHLSTTALPMKNEGEKEELARERKEYIESQSKRILERRGVDTRDGVEGVVEGSRVRSEEVRGLEGLVQEMGKGDGDGEAMDTS